MKYRQLFLLVEGNDDERFFQRIVKLKFKEKHDEVKIWKYAQIKNTKVDNFLKNIKEKGAEYIYVVDINLAPCVTNKKQEIQNKFRNVDKNKVAVVIKEIESWYLAGLDPTSAQQFKLPPFNATDRVTKEKFNTLVPKKFDSRIDFMVEILKYFSIETAKQRNRSFRYFLEKHDCQV